MELVALIIALGIAAAAVGGCIAFGVRAANAYEATSHEVGLRVVAERDRDVANAARVQATAERDNALAQLVKLQYLAASSANEEVKRVKAEATAGDVPAVIDLLGDVLSRDLSGNDDPDDKAS